MMFKNIKEKCIQIWGETFVENCGIYLVVSGSYNSLWIFKLYQFAILLYYFSMFIFTLYYCLYVDEDMTIVAESAHFALLTFLIALFLLSFNVRRGCFDKAFRGLSEIGFDYGDTIDPETEEEIRILYKNTERRKKNVSRLYGAGILFVGITAVFLLPILSGRFSAEEKDDPINRRAPLIKATPYDSKNSQLGWNVSMLCDFLVMLAVVAGANAVDVPFVCFSEEGCNQLDILSLSIIRVFRRAKYVHEKKYGYPVKSYRDERFCRCIEECMNKSIKHHIATISYFKDFTTAYSWPVLIVMFSGALLLCISGIIFVSKNIAFIMKLAFIFYLAAEFTHTFVFAYYGEIMSEKSAGLRKVVYSTEWQESSKALEPYILVIQAYCNTTKIRLSALGFIEYNFDNFGNVLRTAYSYFNLLSASGI